MTAKWTGMQMQSTISGAGLLNIRLVEVTVPDPGPEEVIVRVEAAPMNPSDLALLFGPADLQSLEVTGTEDHPSLLAPVPLAAMTSLRARIDVAIIPGNEGAGTVVAAGDDTRHLLGKRVSMRGGGMYSQYRAVSGKECIVLPEDATCADGASMFINPLTTLCFIETMKMEKHKAIVNFAAASNLGRMLNRLCIKDSVPLVNVVRNRDQASLLRDEGACLVLDSSSNEFEGQLEDALVETGATLAFDPISGGSQASQVLAAMEAAASRGVDIYNRYGSDVLKQVYIYGVLNAGPITLDRWMGFAWSVSAWLLTHRLRQIGPERAEHLRSRILKELKTTFASQYKDTLSLREALRPENVRVYSRRATGEKYLLTPHVQ